MKIQLSNLTFSIIIFLISLSSCTKDWHGVRGSGVILTEDRTLAEFTGVDFQLAGRVNIVQDSLFHVSVSTHDNYQGLIRTYIRDGKLVINSTKSLYDDNITVNVHLPNLDYINLGGSGTIMTLNQFHSSYMKVQITGSGKVDYSGDVNSLHANVSGSGKIYLLGSANNTTMTLSGSGKIKGFSYHTDKNNVTISGSGEIETYVESDLKINITGSGKVYYMGHPVVSQKISGSGKVIHQ